MKRASGWLSALSFFFVVQAYDFVSCFLVAPLANVTRETKRHSLLSTTMEKVVMRQG